MIRCLMPVNRWSFQVMGHFCGNPQHPQSSAFNICGHTYSLLSWVTTVYSIFCVSICKEYNAIMSHLKGWCSSPILLPKRAAKIWFLFIYSPIKSTCSYIGLLFLNIPWHQYHHYHHQQLSSSINNHQPSMDINGPSTINHQPSTINHHPSILNQQQSSIINHQSSIIDHQSSIINHQSLYNYISWIKNHQQSMDHPES